MHKLFDTHCHFDFPAFDHDRPELLQLARERGCERILIPGVRRAGWRKQSELSQSHAELHCAFGLHPYFIDEHQQDDIDELAEWAARPDCIAVGECGLDWAIAESQRDKQLRLFEAQLALAKRVNKPLILHVRKAHPEVLQRLKQVSLGAGGVVHAFSGSQPLAEDYIRQGFKLGVGGVITYARAQKTREALSRVPLGSLVLETDAPDMPLSGEQGQRNRPENVAKVFDTLCELRAEPPELMAAQLWDNSCQLFGLK